jgi:hypothetical protein
MIECPHCRRPAHDKSTFPTIRGVRCERCAVLEFTKYLVDQLGGHYGRTTQVRHDRPFPVPSPNP